MIMESCQLEKADLVVHNAKIYTVDENFSIAEAMAIKNGKVIAIGANNAIKNKYSAEQFVDAELKPIYPGFIDAHCHFLGFGNTFFSVNLVGTKSWEEVVERTKTFAEDYEGLWITGRGWDQNDWEDANFPSKEILDSLFPDRAVFLKRIDGHAAIANQKALELANITTETEVDGGVIKKDDGILSGILIDNAVDLVNNSIPEQSVDEIKSSLRLAEKACLAKGLTTLDDAWLDNGVAKIIDQLHQSGDLKIKVYGMLSPTDENKDDFLKKGPYLTDRLSIRSFKYFADGALGSRGARLIEPYHDDPHNHGLFLSDSNYFMEEAIELNKHGFQMNTHCIGDAANRMILNIYAEVLEDSNDKRWRIEHAQVLKETDLEIFRTYNIIPSVQPTHATSDMYWADERLGEDRIKMAYAYKELLNQNGLIALGTDFPVEDIDPLKTFYAAVIRKDKELYPEGGFQVENALSREEGLKGMTIWAAISNFEEDSKGSLELGKDADFIILDRDIMEANEDEILGAQVSQTYINGELVFQLD